MSLPLVVEPTAVAAADPATLRIVDLRPAEARAAGRIRGSVPLEAALLGRADPPAGGLLPTAETVRDIVAGLDLVENVQLVACDAGGTTEAARLLWVLHAYGVTNGSWLNGGMRAWEAAGLPLERGEPDASATAGSHSGAATGRDSGATPAPAASGAEIVSADELLGQLDDPDLVILDVRGAAEYAGTDVRAAMGGHVPGARHLEWTRLLDAEGRLLDDETLRERLGAVGLVPGRRAVVYCQTHQRSSVTWLALKHLGIEDVRALDGAWSVWGNRPDLPKETEAR